MILLRDNPLAQCDVEMADLIIYKCKKHFNIMNINIKDRHKNFIECRRIIIWFFHKYTDLNVYQMAKLLNLDRCTVLHHYKKIIEFIDTDDFDTNRLLNVLSSEIEQLV